MEKENDVQLIRKILSGNDEAFGALVRKHQKTIHTLAWRKVGDFHIAEEIAQDTFIQVYKNLAQLRNPNQLSGWMYVIATRLCLKWLQKNKLVTQSLEGTPVEEIEEVSYTHHVAEERQAARTEHRHELVHKLLDKLPESERTVVTLHYLGEMTAKEIGKYLGVSINTIKSRLRRGRKRLQEEQDELLVTEILGSIQFPPDFTERILRQVADMTPTPTPVGKPLVPWMAFGTAVVFVVLMLGVGNQYLARFQKPYSFEVESEPTIEIVDAPIVLDILSKPAIRNQFGQSTLPGKSSSEGIQASETTLNSNVQDNLLQSTTYSQWTQGNAPPGGQVRDMFSTHDGTVYVAAPTGMYKLAPDATAWTYVNTDIPIGKSRMPMTEHNGSLYIVSTDEIFASTDNGETWDTLGPRPKGNPVGLVITNTTQTHNSQTEGTMYLALQDKGVFRSTDAGKQWSPLNNGLTNKKISAIVAVEKTVFAGTASGLHRLNSDTWKKLMVETSRAVYSLAVSRNNLYVGTGPELLGLTPIGTEKIVPISKSHAVKIFHSDDLGASWTEITHIDKPYAEAIPSGITVLAAGKTVLALGATQSHSTDGGKTWTEDTQDTNVLMVNNLPAAAVNEKTFYKTGRFGIQRTDDGGKTWRLFIDGIGGTRLKDMAVFNNKLYAHTGYNVYQSTDEGRAWKKLPIAAEFGVESFTSEWSLRRDKVRVYTTFNSKLAVDGNNLYFLALKENKLLILRLSTDGNEFTLVNGIPTFSDKILSDNSKNGNEATKMPPLPGGIEVKTAAVSNDVFYVEYKRGLFKWRLGDPNWINTGLVDTSHMYDDNFRNGLNIAVSEETVYVGKRDGKLFQSLDGGTRWKDVTPNLPLRFTHFKEIIFVGATIYVATDTGVLVSQNAEPWRVLTDSTGAYTVIDRLAIDGTKIYGISDAGIYHLDTQSQWNQISSEVPDKINTLVINNNNLYTATEDRGILHISLDEESYKGLRHK